MTLMLPLPTHQTERIAHRAPTDTLRRLRVALAGRLTAMTAPGGGEVQLLQTARSLQASGVEARMWRPWEDSLTEFDGVHLFGSAEEHLQTVNVAHALHKPVVLSTIAWFDLASVWRDAPHLPAAVFRGSKFLLRSLCPEVPSWRKKLYQSVDLLLPNSQAEAEQLQRYFKIPASKIQVIPNGAEERFAHPSKAEVAELLPRVPYVLYVGRIEPRKNQLAFLQAMRGARWPVVVAGGVVPGQEVYAEKCRRAADEWVTFLGPVKHDSAQMESLYAGCAAVVLCSWFETPGLVALEAGMSGVPLVLPQGGAAREYFGDWAEYVGPNNLAAIRQAVFRAMDKGRRPELAEYVQRNFTWQVAAQCTKGAYERIF